ncbi:MAG: hypothetical protein HKN47_02980, partial [Pirellulaceae bacterium]|nr:hypothetical protein [Pirellulaceae bacterium]
MSQSSQRLDIPRKEDTGGYHGGIVVLDGVFIDKDQYLVLAINESISLFDSQSGERLKTLINGRRGPRAGWPLRQLHVVDDGQTVMTDARGTGIGPNDAQLDAVRWNRWNVSDLILQTEPSPTPFFSRESLDRGKVNTYEKGLQFIQQVGADYAFLSNHHSTAATAICIYRPGDRIDRPRQRLPIEFGNDPTVAHVFARAPSRPPFVCTSIPSSSPRRDFIANLSKYVGWTLSHDDDGKISLASQPITMRERADRKQHVIRDARTGMVRAIGLGQFPVPSVTTEGLIVSFAGLRSPDGRRVAVGSHAEHWFAKGSVRSTAPVAVTVIDPATNATVYRLACGKGSVARPIVFSSDSGLLVTAHD